MLKKIVEDYFTFSRKERVAVCVLIFLTGVIFILPNFIPARQDDINKELPDQFRDRAKQLQFLNKDSADVYPEGDDKRFHPALSPGTSKRPPVDDANLFYFDPNALSPEGWKKLGVRDKTIVTIQKYLSKGGKFRQADDLKKIYGLHKDEAARLLPFVRLRGNTEERKAENYASGYPRRTDLHTPVKKYAPAQVDVNLADTSAFIDLPGIGSTLASRIVRFREKLGGFYAVDQLSEVYGLSDSTYQMIKPRLELSKGGVKLININRAEIGELKQHPYFNWNTANAVIEYRRQHGNFERVEDLENVDAFTPELLKKIAPYLSVQ